ncbi:hypothetical protein AC579_8747 [Pseudocercospora musae]|uniref:Uncharacterized protein n=1 Tax=Pseudocercospora musae TaxID=113226 RepID=A0A139IWE9_9PEZI|nr:hypothetical protein AC579_8747 [Pseudocercospora musae]
MLIAISNCSGPISSLLLSNFSLKIFNLLMKGSLSMSHQSLIYDFRTMDEVVKLLRCRVPLNDFLIVETRTRTGLIGLPCPRVEVIEVDGFEGSEVFEARKIVLDFSNFKVAPHFQRTTLNWRLFDDSSRLMIVMVWVVVVELHSPGAQVSIRRAVRFRKIFGCEE